VTQISPLGISSFVGGVNLGFGSLRTLEGQFGLLGRRTLLFVLWTYGGGGTIGRTLYKPYRRTYVEPPNALYFLNTLWLILGRMR
jgi:hypothetical protein